MAAARGHAVTLCERAAELGGQVTLARQLPGREEFGGIVTNLVREMERHGVEVRLNASLDRALVEAAAPDAVVIATGSSPHTLRQPLRQSQADPVASPVGDHDPRADVRALQDLGRLNHMGRVE